MSLVFSNRFRPSVDKSPNSIRDLTPEASPASALIRKLVEDRLRKMEPPKPFPKPQHLGMRRLTGLGEAPPSQVVRPFS